LAIYTAGTPYHVARNIGIALPSIACETVYRDKSLDDRQKLSRVEKAIQNTYGIPLFTVITCEDVSATKPDPEGLILAMERLNVTPQNVVALGDFEADMVAAVRAGIENRVGITHGFDDREILLQHGASAVVDSLDEFTQFLRHGSSTSS
jgi:phosphoglycolate phosphatase-like HAD superfamily hydrolase